MWMYWAFRKVAHSKPVVAAVRTARSNSSIFYILPAKWNYMFYMDLKNNQRLFLYVELADWFLYPWRSVFTARYDLNLWIEFRATLALKCCQFKHHTLFPLHWMAVYKKQRSKIEFCFLCPSATDTFDLFCCCEQYQTHVKLYCTYVLWLICRLRLNMVCCWILPSRLSRRSCATVAGLCASVERAT